MTTRRTIEAVVKAVTPQPYGADISLEPDGDTWLSVHEDEMLIPRVGDVVVVEVPRVVKVVRREG